MDLPKWMMRDPAAVAERLEEMRQRQVDRSKEGQQAEAARKLKELFKESPNESDNK